MKKVRKKSRPRGTISTRPRSSAKPSRRPKRKKSSSRSRRPAAAYLGLGSNLGNRRAHLRAALDALARLAPLRRVSSVYRTEPVGYADQPDFDNAVAEIAWAGAPEKLLAALRRIEKDLGRVRTFRNGPRVIDIDLLDVGGAVRRGRSLRLPHPRMSGRRFVLAPLAEIAPDWRHPVTGRTATELLAGLPSRPRARRIGPL